MPVISSSAERAYLQIDVVVDDAAASDGADTTEDTTDDTADEEYLTYDQEMALFLEFETLRAQDFGYDTARTVPM
jgi:hypothetical protein